jgi:hypothetical protein
MFDIERKHLLKSIQLDRDQEGTISDLYCVEHLIYALTHHSSVFCYDLRFAKRRWKYNVSQCFDGFLVLLQKKEEMQLNFLLFGNAV